MAKKTDVNAPKKVRVFETRDIDELVKISALLYKAKIAFKITVRTYTPGEPVKYRFTTDPMTDEKREKLAAELKK